MTENKHKSIGALLLAAGGSSRMGRSKQLINYKGQTLIRRAAETLVSSGCDQIVVVLGDENEKYRDELAGLDLIMSINKHWSEGMSSSIRTGLGTLLQTVPNLDAVIITLCDQPHVASESIDLFIDQYRSSDTDIIAAEYNGITGVPALFSHTMFGDLAGLTGDKGARELIRLNADRTVGIKLPAAAFDIDTPEDLWEAPNNT